MKEDTRFCIVGLGLLGGCYAEGLSQAGFAVDAIEINQDSIDFALEKKWIQRGSIDGNTAWLKEADILVLALYPKDVIPWLEAHQHQLKAGCLITDVTGVKKTVVKPIQAMLRKDCEFIGAHPMAGREVSGVRNANVEIFRKANFIITPTEKNSDEAIKTLYELAEILRFGQISELSPEKHDALIGFVSQLTHVIAVCLMNVYNDPDLAKVTGDSFRDLTRIAMINENLWSELFLMNQEELSTHIGMFVKTMQNFGQLLEENQEETMKEWFRHSTEMRRLFEKKEG